MAHRVSMIKLLDGSLHEDMQSAERHLTNMMSSGVCLEVCEDLARKNKVLDIRDYLVKHEKKIEQMMQVVRELNEVLELNH